MFKKITIWQFVGLVGVIAITIIFGITVRSNGQDAKAQALMPNAVSVRVPNSPFSPDGRGRRLRNIEEDAIGLAPGDSVEIGTPLPQGGPGDENKIFPHFSGINAPVWVNQNGAVQIPDDLIVHGLSDVRLGLTNSQGENRRGDRQAGDSHYPVTVYDDLTVSGNDLEPGNITGNGNITASGTLRSGSADISGNLRVIGGQLTVSSDASVYGNMTIGSVASPHNLNVNGKITARDIGTYIHVLSAAPAKVTTDGTWPASVITVTCPQDYTLVSCSPDFGNTDPPSDATWYTKITNTSCGVKARSNSGAKNFYASARAICYSSKN